eukprot:4395948-Pyramimonas_sp.AAC.1
MPPAFMLPPPPTDCTLVELLVLSYGVPLVLWPSLAMAIASITSVISHVIGVSSRVSTSPCFTTTVSRVVSPLLMSSSSALGRPLI